MNMVNFIKTILNPLKIDINRYPNLDLRRRIQIINAFNFNKLFDVGASTGNYALLMRNLGFAGSIISFEPRSDAFSEMRKKQRQHKGWWDIINCALGDEDGNTEINIAGNLDSSSLLEMKATHTNSAPESAYVGKEEVCINKLDTIFYNHYEENDKVFLKIDTQGFEKSVLAGAENSLSKIDGIQLEMSLVSLYKDDLLFVDMIQYLKERDYQLYSLENGFSDSNTGRLLQVDGIFIKQSIN